MQTPPLTPPPASQKVKACGLWSRPGFSAFWAIGRRPNSPPQMTRVSSSSPRWLEIGEQTGERLVGLAGKLLVVSLDIVVSVP